MNLMNSELPWSLSKGKEILTLLATAIFSLMQSQGENISVQGSQTLGSLPAQRS